MKKQTGVWIDSQHAYIIDVSGPTPELHAIDSDIETRVRYEGEGKKYTRVGSVYIDPEKHEERRFEQALDDYLNKVEQALLDADELVIFGPAQTKTRLEKKLMENKILKEKLLATRPAEAMSTNQMVAWVKHFFHLN